MKYAMQQVVKERTERAMDMRSLSASVAKWPGKTGTTIQAEGFMGVSIGSNRTGNRLLDNAGR